MKWQRASRLLSRVQLRLIGAVIATLILASSCAVREPKQVEGTWVITDAVAPGISAMSKEQAKQWLGQSYHYGADQLLLGQIQCEGPVYQEQKLNDSQFTQTYHVPLSMLGAGLTKVQAFTVACDSGESMPGQTVFLTGHQEAFMLWDGVFFKMEKTVQLSHS